MQQLILQSQIDNQAGQLLDHVPKNCGPCTLTLSETQHNGSLGETAAKQQDLILQGWIQE